MDTIAEKLEKVRYIKGHPRQYRAKAKEGMFSLEGRENVGTTASIHVIAFRTFEGTLFNKHNVWAELFFIDEQNNVSCLLFNSYSAKRFQDYQRDLFYQQLSIEQLITEISWEAKSSVLNDGTPVSYHIAKFTPGKELEPEVGVQLKQFTTNKQMIYREGTAPQEQSTETYEVISELNYKTVKQPQVPAPVDEEDTEGVAATEHAQGLAVTQPPAPAQQPAAKVATLPY